MNERHPLTEPNHDAEEPPTPAPTDPQRDPTQVKIFQHFRYDHLPPHLAEVSALFGETARTIICHLPPNAERSTALRKLLEAKDAAVRARLET